MAQFRKDTHQYLKDGTTVFEVVMLADQYGNLVGPANPSGSAVDAFGRARTSLPFTLFDSFHRFEDNAKATTANTATATFAFNANTSSIDCTVDTTANAYVYRESNKVFAYQPGKSLQILQTFVMNPAKNNLRQRIGYFSSENGFFLQRATDGSGNTTVSFVKRSKVTGSVVDTPIAQANWNTDKLDGTGPSLKTLNLDDPQILFTDIEWLGVGMVRSGFVIDGQFIVCHQWYHANQDSSPKGAYMQTACLPVRLEIENTGTTASSSTYKQICTSVISEGGYELSGKQRTYGQDPQPGIRLTDAGTYYPVTTIRLNPNRLDAIVVPKEIGLMPINQANYRWKIISGATITGATWANVSSDSSVQYQSNTSAVIANGTGTVLHSGYLTSTVQSGGTVSLGDGIFEYQLERNSFTSTPTTLTLAVTASAGTCNVAGSFVWQEIT